METQIINVTALINAIDSLQLDVNTSARFAMQIRKWKRVAVNYLNDLKQQPTLNLPTESVNNATENVENN